MRTTLILFTSTLLSLMGCSSYCINKTKPKTIQKEAVILLHGFGRSAGAMWKLNERLGEAGFDVYDIGYRSFTQGVSEMQAEVKKKIKSKNLARYQKVHFVGHSLGGLLIRSFLQEHRLMNLGHVVLLGSPNKGTPVVDYFKDRWWAFLAGPAVKSLSAKGSVFLESLKRPTYPLGVVAGSLEKKEHEHILIGKDDGLVPLESTKVEGMNDFIVIPSSHTYLRYSKIAAAQTINFLKNGKFKKLTFMYPPSIK